MLDFVKSLKRYNPRIMDFNFDDIKTNSGEIKFEITKEEEK